MAGALTTTAAAAAAAAVLLCPLAVVVPASAADGWTAAPGGGARPSFYAEGTAGTALRDTVTVTNRGADPVDVRLTGTGVPVRFADAELRVPARTRAEVPFTVTVPGGAAPGDRDGAIVVRDEDGRTRTLPVRLRTGGPALSALTVEKVAVHAGNIGYDLVNRGTTTLAPRLAVRVEGVFGTVLDRAPRTLPVELPPGRRVRLTEPWPDRPALDAVDVRLTVTAGGGARDSARTSARFVPWGALAGGAAVAAVAASMAVRRRRRRTTTTAAAPVAPGRPGERAVGGSELTGAVV
ncbi:hypothetical protein [Streptomyces sp. NPDC088789]|uniref:hypothetical protein n=1 Tax=Streptomyces sp. NPDC088789 TaxID=3365899 RepID=UPI00382A29E6